MAGLLLLARMLPRVCFFTMAAKRSDVARCLQGLILVGKELLRTNAPHGLESAIPSAVRAVGAAVTAAAEASASNAHEHAKAHENSFNNEGGGGGGEPPFAVREMHGGERARAAPPDPPKVDPSENLWRTEPGATRPVPASPLARMSELGTLAAGVAFGAIGEALRPSTASLRGGGGDATGGAAPSGRRRTVNDLLLTEANAERLATTLCRMRGAALKLGQMLSIQDETLLPPEFSAALERVRQRADRMPDEQLDRMVCDELGDDWRERHGVTFFDPVPIAAASLGQVHHAQMAVGSGSSSGKTASGSDAGGQPLPAQHVAMKVQYPGVARSIGSDLDNLSRLLTFSGLLPRGLYLGNIIGVAKDELTAECDYLLEAHNQKKYRGLLAGEPGVNVPKVVPELSTAHVLTSQLAPGAPLDRVAMSASQEVRNSVAARLLKVTIRELFEFRFMQTDPNWGNFLYDEGSDTLTLIDFGAARAYPKSFVDEYIRLVWAAAERDRDMLLDASLKLGMLTGDESAAMFDAHVAAGMAIGEPFVRADAPYDFSSSDITHRVQECGKVFMRDRLTAPPKEVYSLHRKLSGAIWACVRLGAAIPCRETLETVWEAYDFGPEEGNLLNGENA